MVKRVANKDRQLLENIKKDGPLLSKEFITELRKCPRFSKIDDNIAHPLDQEVLTLLGKIEIREDDGEYQIFYYLNEINELWKLIIKKSIQCLRFFDSREPFMGNESKKPIAYGVKELGEYFDKYSEFESMLYGGSKYYRDHVVHVMRTWLLGLDCLLFNKGEYLKRIKIDEDINVNNLEKLSIWSIIALTHDLGYPLEKAQEIIDKTKDMMKSFIVNPTVSLDLSFNGVQNNMNDFVLRFLSSKMHKKPENKNKPYVARLQPKYYFKFQKSLEKSMHGILSSVIIYKLLLYFLESDYSINEDYCFDDEDARQFYIRREILRSIASHTCKDIYHLDMLSFAYLLIIVDDAQEWGRKRISELYLNSNIKYDLKDITIQFDKEKATIKNRNNEEKEVNIHNCLVKEKFDFPQKEWAGFKRIFTDLYEQCGNYSEIFRDGQDTAKRNFAFQKECEVIYRYKRTITYKVMFCISNDINSSFVVTQEKTEDTTIDNKFGSDLFSEIYDAKHFDIKTEDQDGKIEYQVRRKNV
jgi:hypothetical protein